jgi:multimeric flavodoxin WrbA
MPITLLDALAGEPVGAVIREALGPLGAQHRLEGERFAPRQGCFECWIAHPGTCKVHDAGNDVMRDVIASDELVVAVRPRWGCWDHGAKQALDKLLGLLSPFFVEVDGETHHVRRYPQYPLLGAVAVVGPEVGEDERERLRLLVARNALNFWSSGWVAFVAPDADVDQVRAAIAAARSRPVIPEVTPFEPRPDAVGVPVPTDGRPRRVVVLVGSAKPQGTSASERLGRALADRLVARGWTAEVAPLGSHVKLARAANPRLEAVVGRADLLVVATPVYVDCLPALVLAALEDLAAARPRCCRSCSAGSRSSPTPRSRSRSCRGPSTRWGGGGPGTWPREQAALAGMPLDRGDAPPVRALDLAAEALDRGAPVPPEATAAFATSLLTPWAYRLVVGAGWVWQSARAGALLRLGRRPFPYPAPSASES